MIIRQTRKEDISSLLTIYNHAIEHTTATFDLETQTIEQRNKWFSKYGGRYPLLVAEHDGRVAGYSCLSAYRDKPAYQWTCELSVYVDPANQGKGLGKALMGAILEQAQKLGYHSVISGITAGNDASIKLHEHFHFTFIGSFKEVGYKFESWQDVWFYQLIL
ncbi:GNAT family N-acetyltransferase [Sediminibacillus dalangtanensis]|uniref:GNAT family N-acetyltransferase n=1 Tax=Sediminibacillus dalangtanensis TaxID=2729421 RepID=A0ABX7VT52_9BACI|nr:GNAT family N-acetyltransferase [Sediminibacillus dalangtanensis]QTM99189.1 GNAT family N-acetyltransferase [Sediminibacillus dalangtanensis]